MSEVFEADRKWRAPETAEGYAARRFRGGRAARRDPRLVARLLRGRLAGGGQILDVPCGAGRLAPTLSAHAAVYVGADVSPAMLAAAGQERARVAANIARLPFADASFDAVVCCRLLHHLDERRELPRALAELVRVSRGLVVASFWDAASWPALRRRRGLREDATGRRAIARPVVRALLEQAGAEVLDFAASFRFVSAQTFVVARRRAGPPHG